MVSIWTYCPKETRIKLLQNNRGKHKTENVFGRDEMMTREDYPLILQAKHIGQLLGIARSTAYALMSQNDFPLLEIGGRKVCYRDSFFRWLDSKERIVG